MVANVLTIAGSDPSGGAGIQADLKTFAALDCYGMAVITALTAQNTCGVSAIHVPPPDFVAAEIDALLIDIDIAAIKIGMLGTAAIVETVANCLRAYQGPIVLDPVLVATSGATLGDDRVVAAMKAHLFPLAMIITPNLPEAARLADKPIAQTPEETLKLAEVLHGQAPQAAWLLKGGHAGSAGADDLLFTGDSLWLKAERIPTRNTHGTGCTLSSAIAAFLAKGLPLAEAVAEAKAYLTAALRGADRLSVGRGPGPVDHAAPWQQG